MHLLCAAQVTEPAGKLFSQKIAMTMLDDAEDLPSRQERL